ncbi:S41 family peptidase [Robertkochia solimangrovi]|uniref:S41 family peptidase n=1 Tax=Robertkochia solimangrovi TaxID=2213046 RepID=UPI00117F9C37|nr:S41 family peptidase [Robertkochia solimangrovi]TRZ43805.1 peptidase S41 [Robertkochia solimangrovi]
MKNSSNLLLTILLSLFIVSCSKDDDPGTGNGEGQGNGNEVELNSEINDFVWKAMNFWYYWQSDVTALADSKDDDQDDYYTYLNGYSDSEDLFDDLVYQPGVVDDFSWYIPDVEEQLNEFRGISYTYGINLGYYLVRVSSDSDDAVVYVTYVVPGSPAEAAGITRGDLIYSVDGTVLTVNNVNSAIGPLYYNPTVSLGIAKIEDGNYTPQGDDIEISAAEITENPVFYHSVIEKEGKKIGYLMYNGFRSTFHKELNDVFGEFKSAGVEELVLDLRYNGGGSVLTSAYLASMISGKMSTESVFASLKYNSKRNEANGYTFPFYNNAAVFDKTTGLYTGESVTINRLSNLTRLYVITTRRTASASEMIINGLRPSMEVITIGETTVGKNEGSNTLVDSPPTSASDEEAYLDVDNRNPAHEVGLQPITFRIYNSLGQSEYTDGFEPKETVVEADYVSGPLLPIGDPEEGLLKAVLDDMFGISAKSALQRPGTTTSKLSTIKGKKFDSEMFVLPGEMEYLEK